jgi:hypothetical protein
VIWGAAAQGRREACPRRTITRCVRHHALTVGAKLARDERKRGVSGLTPSRASFAPTGIGVGCQLCERRKTIVGARLAREGGLSTTKMPTDTPLSRASFAPTGIGVGCQLCERRKTIVGARLARDSGVSTTMMSADTPPSRASFAPTGSSSTPLARASGPAARTRRPLVCHTNAGVFRAGALSSLVRWCSNGREDCPSNRSRSTPARSVSRWRA